MPEFADVAAHFDDTDTADAYTGAYVLTAQYTTFNEASLDGSITKKRTMSLSPEMAARIPDRRALEFGGEKWIVGDGNVDTFQNQVVRCNFWMKKVTNEGQLCTPLQLMQSTPIGPGQPWEVTGRLVYANLEFRKDTVNNLSDSQYDPFWDIYTANIEGLVAGMFYYSGGTVYRVRTHHIELNGLMQSGSDQVDPLALVVVTVNTGTIDPVTELPTSTPISQVGILLDYYMVYEYLTEADIKMVSGDKALYLPEAVPVGNTVTVSGEQWRVVSYQKAVDAWVHHIRRT